MDIINSRIFWIEAEMWIQIIAKWIWIAVFLQPCVNLVFKLALTSWVNWGLPFEQVVSLISTPTAWQAVYCQFSKCTEIKLSCKSFFYSGWPRNVLRWDNWMNYVYSSISRLILLSTCGTECWAASLSHTEISCLSLLFLFYHSLNDSHTPSILLPSLDNAGKFPGTIPWLFWISV